jgi:hypothetical protein
MFRSSPERHRTDTGNGCYRPGGWHVHYSPEPVSLKASPRQSIGLLGPRSQTMTFCSARAPATLLLTRKGQWKRDTETLVKKGPFRAGRGATGLVSASRSAAMAETSRLSQGVAEKGLETRKAKAAEPWLLDITCGYQDFDTRISVARSPPCSSLPSHDGRDKGIVAYPITRFQI